MQCLYIRKFKFCSNKCTYKIRDQWIQEACENIHNFFFVGHSWNARLMHKSMWDYTGTGLPGVCYIYALVYMQLYNLDFIKSYRYIGNDRPKFHDESKAPFEITINYIIRNE